jgi:hypothetical protein
MTNAELYSATIEYLAKFHAYRFSKSNFAICVMVEHLLDAHGDDAVETLLTSGTRTQWVNAMIAADNWWREESARIIEAEKRKVATWNLPLNTLGGGG